MQTRNRLFDDLARVANGAMGAVSGIKDEIDAMVRDRLRHLLDEMDLVEREEFEAVKAMAAKARGEQEALAARVVELEAALAKSQKARTKGPPNKSD